MKEQQFQITSRKVVKDVAEELQVELDSEVKDFVEQLVNNEMVRYAKKLDDEFYLVIYDCPFWLPRWIYNKVIKESVLLARKPKDRMSPQGKIWLSQDRVLEQEKRISMLRQWLNEDRIDDPKKMVTNEEIKSWLKL